MRAITMRARAKGVLATSITVATAALLASSAQASDSVYWTNYTSPYGIYHTSSNLDTRGYTFKGGSQGLVFNPAAGFAYWTNPTQNTIGYAEIDGGGSGDLATPGVTLAHPAGISTDTAAGRLYVA